MTASDITDAERIRQRYLAVETSNVADVLDELGLLDQGLHGSFGPFPADTGKLAGWAHTILGEMRPYADGWRGCGQDGRLRAGHTRIGIGLGRCGNRRLLLR